MNLTKTSKYLSMILRHRPEAAGICLDEHGWARVDPEKQIFRFRQGNAGGDRPDRQQAALFL